MAMVALSSGDLEIYGDRAEIYWYNPEQGLALKLQCLVPALWPAGSQHGTGVPPASAWGS